MRSPFDHYDEIWCVDFEYRAPRGGRPQPLCLVARELKTRRLERRWHGEFATEPPYRTDARVLFVAYYAAAELACHRSLGWRMPERVLDLFTEFRCATNAMTSKCPSGLLDACAAFDIGTIAAADKETMRRLILSEDDLSLEQRRDILDYCQSDVDVLAALLERMAPRVDLPRALLRGRAMAATAVMEANGIPIDVATLGRLARNGMRMKGRLIAEVDSAYGVYDGDSFKRARFARWLNRRGIAWPTLPSGQLQLDDDTFREQARIHPELADLHQLRGAIAMMQEVKLAVGPDARNRTMLSPFRAKTSRFQPSAGASIFGPSVWLRGLIKPPDGFGIAYIDWEQQEFGIAAALSGDQRMQNAYQSGDPYLEFAKQAGAVPPEATKATHPIERERFKACVLAVQYGMGANGLARRIGQSPAHAMQLLNLHRRTYPQFWAWSDLVVTSARLRGQLKTVFGWTVQVAADAREPAIRNFPMQANGAEMLRLACCQGVEAGIRIAMPVHDALLIEAPLETLDAEVARMQAVMAEASRIVLNGFALRSDAKVIRAPDRYADPRGAVMWKRIMRLLDEIEPDLRAVTASLG